MLAAGAAMPGAQAPLCSTGLVSRRFPIMKSYDAKMQQRGWIPWELIAPHEAQAQSNHGGQTLRRLAERGGLDAMEAVAVLEDMDYRKRWPEHAMTRERMTELQTAAIKRLDELCEAGASAND